MAYHFLEHTADLGIEASAASLEELFVECLRAQTDCLTRLHRVEEKDSREIELVSPCLSELLVDFLSEAIYLYETAGLVLANAKLEVTEIEGGWSLSGVVAGEEFDLPRHGLKTLLKAVTYHELSVRRYRSGWTARVIFDI